LIALNFDLRHTIHVDFNGAFPMVAAAPDLGAEAGHLLSKHRSAQRCGKQ
jgi:hypothetical protein